MRPFLYLPVVPRPDTSLLAIHAIALAVYLAFAQLEPSVAGQPTSAFQLAVATFFFAAVARNLILNRALWSDRTRITVASMVALALPWAAFAIIRADGLFVVQLGLSIWLLVYSTIMLSLLREKDADISFVPSIWVHEPVHGRMAVNMVALGDAAFAITLTALTFWGDEAVWFYTLIIGMPVLKFAVNWAIVLTIAARLDDD